MTLAKKPAKKTFRPSWPKITDDLLAQLSQDPDFREPAREDPPAFKALLISAIRREKRRITGQIQLLSSQRGTVLDHDLCVSIARAFIVAQIVKTEKSAQLRATFLLFIDYAFCLCPVAV